MLVNVAPLVGKEKRVLIAVANRIQTGSPPLPKLETTHVSNCYQCTIPSRASTVDYPLQRFFIAGIRKIFANGDQIKQL